MKPILIAVIISITMALIFYTIGVWSEHRAKVLMPKHLAFFWLGLCFDATGTELMSHMASGSGGGLMTLHGITGMIAIILMLVHAVWATAVMIRKDEQMMHTFHRFSITVWVIWLVPFVLGMIMGMR